jgi:serine/threonine protein kinase
MLTAGPLFPGVDDRDQIERIFKGLGTPTVQSWPGMVELPNYHPEQQLPSFPGKAWGELVPGLEPAGADLLRSCLEYEPQKRESAKGLLTHEYVINVEHPE